MFKTFVIWAVLVLHTEDQGKVPVALASPDRPFATEEECLVASNVLVEKLSKDLTSFGVENFGVMATCVPEVHGARGLRTYTYGG